jgi:biopolymer transport protein ExbD
LRADGRVAVDGQTTTVDHTAPALTQIRVLHGPEVVIDLAGDEDARAGLLCDVHRSLQQAGLLRARYLNDHGWQMPLVLPSEELVRRAEQLPAELIAEVSVAPEGRCALSGQDVATGAPGVTAVLRELLAAVDHLIVRVRIDRQASYQGFLGTMDAVRRTQASRVLVGVAQRVKNDPGTPWAMRFVRGPRASAHPGRPDPPGVTRQPCSVRSFMHGPR